MSQSESLEAINLALGRVPSGVFILTAAHKDQATGMLTSWVQQAGFDPPTVTVAVKNGRYLVDWLTAGAPFALNIVGEKDAATLKHFANGFAPDEPAFEGVEHRLSPKNTPILTSAIGHMECETTGHIDSGDHRIFVAKVIGGELAEDRKPMVHIRRSGAKY